MEPETPWNVQVSDCYNWCNPDPSARLTTGRTCICALRFGQQPAGKRPAPSPARAASPDIWPLPLQDYSWNPYSLVASAAQCDAGNAGRSAFLAAQHSQNQQSGLGGHIGQAALASMDFAAQLSMINTGAGTCDVSSPPGDEGRGRGRSFSRCQVTGTSNPATTCFAHSMF